MQLLGKAALITGGASGIGRAFARALAREGADVAIADLDDRRLEQARAELGGMYTRSRVVTLRVDVRKDDQVKAMVADAIGNLGGVDVLVNSAGVLLAGDLGRISSRDWSWMLQTNLLGAVRSCTAVVNHMSAKGSGQIVNVVSFGGLLPQGSDSLAYDSGEAAIAAFTRGLALTLAPKGVAVTLLCTGCQGPRPGQNTRLRGEPGLRGWLPRSGPSDDGSQGLEGLERLLLDALRHRRSLAVPERDHRALRAYWKQLESELAASPEPAVT
jgi:meso-butanediol dehydrogenase/(S,S)-butanediol dehydrogenase/diacetyl reductase